jgi:hypothetical protein
LILLATVHILLFVANIAAVAALRHGAPYVNPFAPAAAFSAYFALNPVAVRVGNFLMFGSAIPLGIFAVTAVSRMRFLGVRAAGTNIALFGGITATIALIFSALFGWVLSVPETAASPALAKTISLLCFLCGGVAFAVGFGLLAAGISITGYFTRLLPRWLVALGMVVAVAGEFSSFSLLAYPANFLIPITRYLGIVWMILAAVKLTRGRDSLQSAETPSPVD